LPEPLATRLITGGLIHSLAKGAKGGQLAPVYQPTASDGSIGIAPTHHGFV